MIGFGNAWGELWMHLRDMLDVGLLDARWCDRFPDPLSARLQELIDNPDG